MLTGGDVVAVAIGLSVVFHGERRSWSLARQLAVTAGWCIAFAVSEVIVGWLP